MGNDPTYKYRFPGIVSFTEQQSHLFFGRDKEIKELLSLILAEKTVVLFSRSGAGKSSLLAAGICPELTKNNILPIKVRFPHSIAINETARRTPLEALTKILEEKRELIIKKEEILVKDDTPKLWEYFKVITFQNATTPVLIFDQFEEFFYYPEKQQYEFMCQLAELLHHQAPNRILDWIGNIKSTERTPQHVRWTKQPMIKCIFVIREDRLSDLDHLKRFVPLILRNRYKLFPLSMRNAEEALTKPGMLKKDLGFRSKKFSFPEKGLLNEILLILTGASTREGHAENVTNISYIIDGTQLQTVCAYIERKVIAAQDNFEEIVPIDSSFINPKKEIKKVLDNFYENQLYTIGSLKEISIARTFIETHLVGGGARTIVTEKQMLELLNQNTELVEKMLNARLIKEEFTHLGKTYELSHDTLVPAVAKFADKRRYEASEKERKSERKFKRVYLTLSIVAGLALIISIYALNKLSKVLTSNNLSLAEKYYQQNNHYVAFSFWDNYLRNSWRASPRDKDSIRQLISGRTLFDIAHGESIVGTTDSLFIIQNSDGTVYIWKTDAHYKKLLCEIIRDAYGAELSDTKMLMAYRNGKGSLAVYDLKTKEHFQVPGAEHNPVGSKNADLLHSLDAEVDSRKSFVCNSNIIAYINKAGEIYLFDAEKKESISLKILKEINRDFYTSYIRNNLKISANREYLAIKKNDSLKIWNIKDARKPTRQRVIKNVDKFYPDAVGDFILYSRKDDPILVIDTLSRVGSPTFLRTSHYRNAILSKSKLHFYFIDAKYNLVIYDLRQNQVDTVLDDVTNISRPRSGIRRFIQWAGTAPALLYLDAENHPKMYDLRKRQSFSVKGSLDNYYSFSETLNRYAYLDDDTVLRVVDLPSERTTFSVSIKATSAVSNHIINEIDLFALNKTGNKIVYMKIDTDKYYLYIADLASAKTIFFSDKFILNGIDFTDERISLTDEFGRNGTIFFTNKERDTRYFRELFQKPSKEQMTELGISTLF